MSKYIATLGLSNVSGIGIVEIDHSFDLVNFEVIVGDEIIDIVNAPITHEFNDETEEYDAIFYWGLMKLNLNDFMRV